MKQAKARPQQFKQPFYADAASQIMLAGVGTLVCLSSEATVRQHESEHQLAMFDNAFGVRYVGGRKNLDSKIKSLENVTKAA